MRNTCLKWPHTSNDQRSSWLKDKLQGVTRSIWGVMGSLTRQERWKNTSSLFYLTFLSLQADSPNYKINLCFRYLYNSYVKLVSNTERTMASLRLSLVSLLFTDAADLLYSRNQKAPNVIQSSAIPGREPKPTELWEGLEISHARLELLCEAVFFFCSSSALR